jgi:hypothetical protein
MPLPGFQQGACDRDQGCVMKRQSNVCAWQPPSNVNVGSVRPWEMLGKIPQFAPSMWVKVFNPPTAFSFDEAWLLCEYSENQWLAWIPDYGEILLSTDEFCAISE